MTSNFPIFRNILGFVLLAVSLNISLSASADPSAEDTFRYIENRSHDNDGWHNDMTWKFDGGGNIRISYYVKDPYESDDKGAYYNYSISMDLVENLEIIGIKRCSADIAKCRVLNPNLILNCKSGWSCVSWENRVFWDEWETNTGTRNSFNIKGWSKSDSDYRDEAAKESAYKMKNAVSHLFKLKGIPVEFDDNYFVDDNLFSDK